MCCHPLTQTIDFRDPYPIALIGHAEASKTTTIIALIELLNKVGPEALGVESFAPTESTMHYLRELDLDPSDPNNPDVFTKFRSGVRPNRTDASRHRPPLEFVAGFGSEKSCSVLIQDLAGEDVTHPELRPKFSRYVFWADAILFIYNPEDSPLLKTTARQDQAILLNGIFEDLEAYGGQSHSPSARSIPPLIFAVSKCDLLPNPPDLRNGIVPEAQVEGALKELNDTAVLAAARRWGDDVHFRFIAPMPENGGEPQGVVELFNLLLSVINRRS